MDQLKRIYWRALEFPKVSAARLRRFLEPHGPGDWIFEVSVISWAFDPALRRQLPWTHQLFAAYAALFTNNPGNKILAGDRLFSLVSSLYRLFGLAPQLTLRLGGYTIFLNPSDPRMWQVPNELTNPDLDAIKLRHFLALGDTFIDVGANHGSFSLVASQIVGPSGRIVAIEPQPTLSRLVELSLQETARCIFVVHKFACSDHEGTANFYVPTGSSGSAGLISAFSAQEQHQTFSVALKRFDDAVDWRSLPGSLFVKLDVEGSELAFLRGAQDMVRERRPKIMMEVNPTSMAGAGVELGELVTFFRDSGYTHFIELNQLDKCLPLEDMSLSPRNVVICAGD